MTMTMTAEEGFSLFTQFPPEIQRLIFEEAFEESHRKDVHIALVSRDVQSWIEPLMYQCISLNCYTYTKSGNRRFGLFASTFQDRLKPEDFYTRYVQRLFIDDLQKMELAEKLLPLCSNLMSLACWARPDASSQTILRSLLSPDTPSLPRLRRLSIYWGCLPIDYQSFHHPIFRNLTHLDIDFDPHIRWEVLALLENLKYFNLDCISACSRVQNVKEATEGLETIIKLIIPYLPISLRCFLVLAPSSIIGRILFSHGDDACDAQQFCSDIVSGEYDVRLVLGSSPAIPMPPKWEHGQGQQDFVHSIVPVPYNLHAWAYLAPGHTDFWMEAEGIVEERRRKLKNRSPERI